MFNLSKEQSQIEMKVTFYFFLFLNFLKFFFYIYLHFFNNKINFLGGSRLHLFPFLNFVFNCLMSLLPLLRTWGPTATIPNPSSVTFEIVEDNNTQDYYDLTQEPLSSKEDILLRPQLQSKNTKENKIH